MLPTFLVLLVDKVRSTPEASVYSDHVDACGCHLLGFSYQQNNFKQHFVMKNATHGVY